ncbi:MAG: membrane glycosyltransferase [Glaciecola sp.]|jgi:membrane glycosyltransferase|uniref:glucans biosynthesis glucosyltransferase MdoH n=1 Tax=Congregibacter sp. TaxID=2744308 RepID=UPI0039E6D39A
MSFAEITSRPLGTQAGARTSEAPSGVTLWLFGYLALTTLGGTVVVAVVAASVAQWSPAAWLALVLVALGAIWIAGGAATAILGLLQPRTVAAAVPDNWHPAQRSAILMLLCGEPAEPLADYLQTLRRRADALGLDKTTPIFVLSDTSNPQRVAAEQAAFTPLVEAGTVSYRRRIENTGRKPGNIANWLATHGDDFSFMVVLDADSRMQSDRIRALMHRMEQSPDLGLLQAGISLVRGRSLFGRHQRLSGHLLAPNFGRGLAAWSGDAGNYWGHNAIIRIAAFRSAVDLPVLSGKAPFGGPPLSHDFVEAAWIRRAGWSVALDPDTRGSAEDGPQTLAEFHHRDRRWCQGNLQHLRLITEPGLHPVSRVHLAAGIAGYLAAPVWLALMVLVATDLVAIDGALPLVAVATVLLLPKVCAFIYWAARARTALRRRVIFRVCANELLLSTLIAPLVMLRQSGAVLSVLLGRDCGWKSNRAPRSTVPTYVPEVAVGASLVLLGAATGQLSAVVWLLPVALPLLFAPRLHRWLDRDA